MSASTVTILWLVALVILALIRVSQAKARIAELEDWQKARLRREAGWTCRNGTWFPPPPPRMKQEPDPLALTSLQLDELLCCHVGDRGSSEGNPTLGQLLERHAEDLGIGQ